MSCDLSAVPLSPDLKALVIVSIEKTRVMDFPDFNNGVMEKNAFLNF